MYLELDRGWLPNKAAGFNFNTPTWPIQVPIFHQTIQAFELLYQVKNIEDIFGQQLFSRVN